jgi:hypothetical protein
MPNPHPNPVATPTSANNISVPSRSPSIMVSPPLFTPSTETSDQSLFGHHLSNTTAPSTTTDTSFNFTTNNDPFVSYDGFYNWGSTGNDTLHTSAAANASSSATNANGPGGASLNSQINDDSMNNFPLPTNNFSWQNMPMDIDQDWSWFLNDNQAGSTNVTMAGGNETVGDQFTQQGFVGFG